MDIEAVLFDWGGVLTESPLPGLATIAVSAGAAPPELADLLVGGNGENGDHPMHRFERGEITLAELTDWGRREGALRGWDLDLSQIVSLVAELPARPAMIDYVAALRDQGLRTALITNNAIEVADLWRAKLPIDELFDAVVVSCDVGMRKPEARIFAATLAALGHVRPEAAVFLDDTAENAIAAADFGIRAVLVGKDPADAIRQVERILTGSDDRGPAGVVPSDPRECR
jgi:putative hydrolase of the HAD superfamily